MSAIDELKDMGYTLIESDSPNRQKYDFSMSDREDNVAWVWGDDHDLDYECNHPDDCIEYDDDETVGECLLCGSHCSWHREESADDGYTISERVPHEWCLRSEVGGLIKKIIEEQKGAKW